MARRLAFQLLAGMRRLAETKVPVSLFRLRSCQFGRRKRARALETRGSLSIRWSKAWGGVNSGIEIMLSAPKMTGSGPTSGQGHALGAQIDSPTPRGESRLRSCGRGAPTRRQRYPEAERRGVAPDRGGRVRRRSGRPRRALPQGSPANCGPAVRPGQIFRPFEGSNGGSVR